MNAREQSVGLTVGDPYRLGRRIGVGNMGAVYDAHHLRHEKRCVVKVMNSATADSSEAVARFHSQAEIASRLAHQNLVRVLDFGTAASGEPFLVMERLEGEDLARRLQRTTRLEPAMAAHICRQVAAALAAAHDRGVVHAALKPTNIFLVPRENDLELVKVLDCGTAQVENARALVHPASHAGLLQDTLPYVAPEQAGAGNEARTIDHRTDQWALACVAWHMVTGRPPFAGEDATALLYQIAYEDPLPVADDVQISTPALAAVMKVLRQALEKRPDSRFSDVTAFARALVDVTGPLTPPPKAKPTPTSRKKAAEAAPRATLLGMPAVMAPSEPVFLPGVSRRTSPKQPRASRASAAAQTRVQGLRVRTSQEAQQESQGDTPPDPTSLPPARPTPSPAPAVSGWAALRDRAAALPRRRWMLMGALPVGVALVLLFGWSMGSRRPPVSVDRAPAAPSPAPTTTGPRPGTGRPVIIPIASRSRGPVAGSRRRARASRAKRAALLAKTRRAESRRDRRGSRPR
jgi:serine/threonine protein kinase